MLTPARPVTPVAILAKTLARLCRRVEDLGISDDVLRTQLQSAAALAGGLEPYVARCTSPESPALAELSRRTRAHDWTCRSGPGAIAVLEQEMLSGHVEGQALKFLIRMTRARRVLEIGMFTGYSALAIAEALPADGHVIACEIDPDVAAFAQHSFDEVPAGARIEVRVGPALMTLKRLAAAGETFDFVFVDADKGGYVDYVAALIDGGLLAPEGIICVDNTLMQGEPYRAGERSANGEAIAAFNDAVMADPRLEQVLLPLRDGMTLIRRL